MLFGETKKFESEIVAQQIKQTASLIEQYGYTLEEDTSVDPIFEEVEVKKEEVLHSLRKYATLISQVAQHLQKQQRQFNLKILDQVLCYVGEPIQTLLEQEQSLTPIEKAIKALQLTAKMTCFYRYMDHALDYEDDITAFPLHSQQQYQTAYIHIEVVESEDPQQTERQVAFLKKIMVISSAAVLTQHKQSNHIVGALSFWLSYPRFYFDYKEAQLRAWAFLHKPVLQKLKAFWGLPQTGLISQFKYILFPSITHNRVIHIPAEQRQFQAIDLFTPSPDKIPIRILSDKPVVFWDEKRSCCGCSSSQVQIYEKVIIYVHGGGFISLSSDTMQNYTRLWSKELQVPVLAIDYRKAPEHAYPGSIQDVFQAYRFIVSQDIFRFCNIRPKTVVMAGDSAGGTISLAASALIIKNHLPLPRGYLLAYPATDLRSIYTPSRIHSFNQIMLFPSLLLMCLSLYLGQQQQQVQGHPLSSPLFITEEFVRGRDGDSSWPREWPRTRLMVGQLDPLLDDSIKLCQKMAHGGVDVKCRIYRGLGHAFLNMDALIKQAEVCVADSVALLKELFA